MRAVVLLILLVLQVYPSFSKSKAVDSVFSGREGSVEKRGRTGRGLDCLDADEDEIKVREWRWDGKGEKEGNCVSAKLKEWESFDGMR